MAHRYIESWLLWIFVDVIAIGIYLEKDVPFLSLLYVVLLVMAISGLLKWRSERLEPPVPVLVASS
jgi:nicotinamide mononucleotide transporter